MVKIRCFPLTSLLVETGSVHFKRETSLGDGEVQRSRRANIPETMWFLWEKKTASIKGVKQGYCNILIYKLADVVARPNLLYKTWKITAGHPEVIVLFTQFLYGLSRWHEEREIVCLWQQLRKTPSLWNIPELIRNIYTCLLYFCSKTKPQQNCRVVTCTELNQCSRELNDSTTQKSEK